MHGHRKDPSHNKKLNLFAHHFTINRALGAVIIPLWRSSKSLLPCVIFKILFLTLYYLWLIELKLVLEIKRFLRSKQCNKITGIEQDSWDSS